jgi:hypothetical protein
VLNFEARGAAGRTYMFETGRTAPPDRGVRRAVASPSASSLARSFTTDAQRTDFTIPKRLASRGELRFIGDEAAYHTALATPERLDQGSLQHYGRPGAGDE